MIPKIIHYAWIGSSLQIMLRKELMNGKKSYQIGLSDFGMKITMISINLSLQDRKFLIRNGGTLQTN